MRSLFIAPNEIEGLVFINEAGEKFLLTSEEFSPTDIDESELTQVNFDTTIQAVVNNAQMKFDAIKADITYAIENFE